MIIEIVKALLLLGRSEEAANLTQQALQQEMQQQQQQKQPINPHILLATALTFLFEGLIKEAYSYLKQINIQEHLQDEYIQRTYAEYILLSSGNISQAWSLLLPFLRISGPNWPPSIPMYQKDTTLKVGMRLLIRLCHPIRFLGFIPWFIEKGLKVSVLVAEEQRELIERILPSPMILTTKECNSEDFDYIIDDMKLPTLTSQVSWYTSIKYNPTKKIGLYLFQEEGIGPGLDLPESLEQEVFKLFQTRGYNLTFLDEKDNPKDILPILDTLQGVIVSEGFLADYSAALGIPAVFVGSLLVDSFWRSPKIHEFYPALRVVIQKAYGNWEGIAENIVQTFDQLQKEIQENPDVTQANS